MKDESLYEKIDQYLDGEMQSGERQAFERAAQQDAELFNLLEGRRNLHAVLDDGVQQQKVDALVERGARRDQKRTIRRYATGLAAAAVLAVGALMLWPGENTAVDEAAPVKKESAEPIADLWNSVNPPDLPQSLGTNAVEPWQDNWREAKLDFQSRRYTEAAPKLASLLQRPDVPQNLHSRLRLMLGYAYFDQGEWAAAKEAFSSIPITNSLEREAQYYLALTALKQKNRPEAKRRLRLVAEDDQNPYQKEARTWLASLAAQ